MTNAEVSNIFPPPSSFCRCRAIRYWFSLPIINVRRLSLSVWQLFDSKEPPSDAHNIRFCKWFSSKDDTAVYGPSVCPGVVLVAGRTADEGCGRSLRVQRVVKGERVLLLLLLLRFIRFFVFFFFFSKKRFSCTPFVSYLYIYVCVCLECGVGLKVDYKPFGPVRIFMCIRTQTPGPPFTRTRTWRVICKKKKKMYILLRVYEVRQ